MEATMSPAVWWAMGGPVQEKPQEHADGQHGSHGDADDRLHRQVALGQGELLTGVALGTGCQGIADAGDDGTEDLQEGPDGGDGDGSGAHDAHLAGEGGAHEVREVRSGRGTPQVRTGSSTP